MIKPVVKRWVVLGTILAVTLVAAFYPIQEPAVFVAADGPVRKPVPVRHVETARKVDSSEWLAADSDPFAPRGWVEPIPSPSVFESKPVAALPMPSPSLPYKFVGQMRDGSDTVVYLSLGDKMVLARAGEVLDGGYKVTAISPANIEFESVTHGGHHTLPIPVQD